MFAVWEVVPDSLRESEYIYIGFCLSARGVRDDALLRAACVNRFLRGDGMRMRKQKKSKGNVCVYLVLTAFFSALGKKGRLCYYKTPSYFIIINIIILNIYFIFQ